MPKVSKSIRPIIEERTMMADESFEERAELFEKSVKRAAKRFMTEKLSTTFERRVELFKKSVEEAAKCFMVELTSDYIQSCHDYHVVIQDKIDEHKKVYYDTLTQEEY